MCSAKLNRVEIWAVRGYVMAHAAICLPALPSLAWTLLCPVLRSQLAAACCKALGTARGLLARLASKAVLCEQILLIRAKARTDMSRPCACLLPVLIFDSSVLCAAFTSIRGQQ